MINRVILFLVNFFLPLLVLRPILQTGAKRVAHGSPWKTTGWRTHHHHFGVLLVMLGVGVMIASNNDIFSLVPTGLGLGLMTDELIASLFLPHEEPEASRLYRWSLPWTIGVFCLYGGYLLGLYMLFK